MSSGFEIIDCHIHPYVYDSSATNWFSLNESPEEFAATLKSCGISKACGSVIRLGGEKWNFEDIKKLNSECLEFRDLLPDFFIPGIHVHPEFPEESCVEIEKMYKKEDVRWIGELVGYISGYNTYVSKGAFQIYELADSLNMPVNIHFGEMSEVDEICNNFPSLKVVIAHPTSVKDFIIERVQLVKKYPNLFLDISGIVTRFGMLRYAVDEAGKEKILFGTDYPVCSPGANIGAIMSEKLTDDEKTAIFSENFKRLISLES